MMKITKRQLRRYIREELNIFSKTVSEGPDEESEEGEKEAPEAKNKIIKGLSMIGVDEAKLKDLPSNEQQLRAFMDMIDQALDTTIAGKAVAAEKKVAAGTKGME